MIWGYVGLVRCYGGWPGSWSFIRMMVMGWRGVMMVLSDVLLAFTALFFAAWILEERGGLMSAVEEFSLFMMFSFFLLFI